MCHPDSHAVERWDLLVGAPDAAPDVCSCRSSGELYSVLLYGRPVVCLVSCIVIKSRKGMNMLVMFKPRRTGNLFYLTMRRHRHVPPTPWTTLCQHQAHASQGSYAVLTSSSMHCRHGKSCSSSKQQQCRHVCLWSFVNASVAVWHLWRGLQSNMFACTLFPIMLAPHPKPYYIQTADPQHDPRFG